MALPEGYKQIEYVQSNGTGSYFKTGILPTANTRVVFDGYVISGDTALYGSRYAAGNNRYAVQYIGTEQYRLSYDSTEDLVPASYTKGTRYVFDQRNNELYINDVLAASVVATPAYPNAREVYAAGALNTNNTASNLGVVRMYAMKIYQDDVLVRDFLPVQDADGSIGIYDIIGNAFYANAGTGDVAGGEVLRHLTGIAITTPPDKTEYQYGEELDLAGLVVIATFSDNTTEAISGYSVSGYNPEQSGAQEITITYQEYSVEFSVSVAAIKPVFTVTFIGWDGTTIAIRTVEEGQGAEAPEVPVREGYLFIGWDKDFLNVTGDITVTARYDVWLLEKGILAISANISYSTASKYPWYKQRETVKEAVLLSGVTSIGASAFNGCTSLTSITIPSGVTSIGASAFNGCASLTSITIPSGVTSIGNSVFSRCASLTSITIPSGVTNIGNGAFNGCASLERITIPSGATSIGLFAFHECIALTSVKLPNSITSIGASAFDGCTSLVDITIPVGVTSIEDSVFSECASLERITIPSGVTNIGNSAFYGCNTLTDIVISDSVTSIGGYTFYNCASLERITIPSGVTNIGNSAFNGCASLTSITIPSGVTSIGNSAFNRCIALEKIIFLNKDTSIYDDTNCIPVNAVIYGYSDSSAKAYAEKYGRMFIALEGFTVIFVDWDESVLSEQSVPYGESAIAPEVPVREGYSFTGWDKDFSAVTEDMTVTAQYQADAYTVTFVDWDGAILGTQMVEAGQSASAPDVLGREGYTFVGWDIDFTNVTKDMIVTAQYSIITFTVTFEDWDGTTLAVRETAYKTAADPPADPERNGYFFLGWDTDFSEVIEDMTVHALYDLSAVLTVSPSELQLIRGETEVLTYILGPDELKDKNIIWDNTNPSVVRFDPDTLQVTTWGPGISVLTATHVSQRVSASCTVTVLDYSGVSEGYKEAIKNNNRGIWDAIITADGNLIPKEDIVKLRVNEIEFKESKLGIGSVVSSYVEITLRNRGTKFLNRALTFKIGMRVGGEIEYVPFGIFYVTDSEGGEDDETVEITAYDSVKKTEKTYSTALTYPAQIRTVAAEIAEGCGLRISKNTVFPDIQISSKIKAGTCKDALSVIAQLMGCNVVADRSSELDFRFFNMTDIMISAASRYFSFKRKDIDSYVRSVKIVNSNGIFTATGATSGGEENALDISIVNTYGTQEIAQRIYDRIAMTYRAGEVEFLGDPSIQVGDIITVIDKNGKSFLCPVMENVIEYDGGVKNSVRSYSESEEEQEFTGSSRTTEERLDNMESDLDDLNEIVYGTADPGTGEIVGGMLKCVSCTVLPENPDSNTIYLIQGEVTVT